MGLIQESDVSKLFNDQVLMDEIVSGLVQDSSTMDQLTEDIADKVQDSTVKTLGKARCSTPVNG